MHLRASTSSWNSCRALCGVLLLVSALLSSTALLPSLATAGSLFGQQVTVCGRCGYDEPRTRTRKRKRRPSQRRNNNLRAINRIRWRGYQAEKSGNLNEAEAAYREVLRLKPGDNYSNKALPRTLEKLEKREEARQAARRRRERARRAAEIKGSMHAKVDALRFEKGSRTSAPVQVMQGPLEWDWEGSPVDDAQIAQVRKVQRRLRKKWAADFKKLKDLQLRVIRGDRDARKSFHETRQRIRGRFEDRLTEIYDELLKSHRALFHNVATKSMAELEAEFERDFEKWAGDLLIEELAGDLALMVLNETRIPPRAPLPDTGKFPKADSGYEHSGIPLNMIGKLPGDPVPGVGMSYRDMAEAGKILAVTDAKGKLVGFVGNNDIAMVFPIPPGLGSESFKEAAAADEAAVESQMNRNFYDFFFGEKRDPQYGMAMESAMAFAKALEEQKIMRARAQSVRDMSRTFTLLEQQGILKKGENLVHKSQTDPLFRGKISGARSRILAQLKAAEMTAAEESRKWLREKLLKINAKYPAK